MSKFSYTARGPHGQVTGMQEAASAGAVAAELQAKGWVPLTIKPEGAAPAAAQGMSAPMTMPAWLAPKVLPIDIMLFSRQLHTLYKAGVPLLRALNGLQDTAQNPSLKHVIREVRRNLEGGVELSASMAMHPKVFDSFYISMVRVGEASGKLDEVFARLASHMEFEMFMRQQVKSATRYPTFVIMAMVGALTVINVMVVPAFAGVFKSLGADLPLPTQILIASSNLTLNHGGSILTGLTVAFFVWRQWVGTPSGRWLWDKILLRMPLVGPILLKASLARFTRAFALSLRSGVPMERAISGVAQTTGNAYISRCIEEMRDRLMRGETLTSSAVSTGVFTPMVLQMISVGEETGMVDELLDEVGELYNEDVQYALKTLSQQIEPILIVFMGAMVLVLALGVFLPMWNMGHVAIKH
jgi:MSHA biogenesis protein MshG